MAAMPNWIDRLWADSHDREAEQALRELWLRIQSDRKGAWDELRNLAATSEKLMTVARKEIRAGMYGLSEASVDNLAFEAVRNAIEMLHKVRWTIPAGNPGVFVPYLRHRSAGLHHWVQRAISDFRSRHGEPLEERRVSEPATGWPGR